MAQIIINHLTYSPTGRTSPVLNDLHACLADGQFTLLTGRSGSGKSTLLRLLAGLTSLPSTAQITLDGHSLTSLPVTERARHVALLFQEPSTQFTMDTVINELRFVLENRQVAPAEMPDRITAALAFVGIKQLAHRRLTTLSGGEQQKVALALIVAMDSDVILLDEPFANIDPAARQAIMTRLSQLCKTHHKTIVLADHDLSDYGNQIDQLAVLHHGQLTVLDAPTTQARLADFATARDQLTPSLPSLQAPRVLTVTDLGLTRGTRTLLTVPTLALIRGKTTLITGPNGSGKSTFFKALIRLIPYHGTIAYLGTPINRFRKATYARHVSLMFQTTRAQFLNVTVGEELALCQQRGNVTYFTPTRIQTALVQLGLANRQQQVIYTLSSGQQKKLQLLCLLIMAPAVLLLDEPFAGLDLDSVQVVYSLLRTTQQALGLSIVLISHQLTGIGSLIDYHLQLSHQRLRYQEAPHEPNA